MVDDAADRQLDSEAAARHRRYDSLEQEAFLGLWRTYDRLKAVEDDLFGRYDLSAQQYNTLRLLRSVHPDKLPTLAVGARLVSRAPDITRLVDKLVALGLAVRERGSDDRRAVHIGITEAGLELLKRLDREVAACNGEGRGGGSPDDLRRLIELLRDARRPHEDAATWR